MYIYILPSSIKHQPSYPFSFFYFQLGCTAKKIKNLGHMMESYWCEFFYFFGSSTAFCITNQLKKWWSSTNVVYMQKKHIALAFHPSRILEKHERMIGLLLS